MGLRPEIFGVDGAKIRSFFACKDEALYNEFISKFENISDPEQLKEIKELARLVFFEPIKLSTFSSKRTPIGGNKRGENGDVHVPVAVQLALFKQEGMVPTDSNFYNGGGYFDEVAELPGINENKKYLLDWLCGMRCMFQPNQGPQQTSWSYYGFLTKDECLELHQELQNCLTFYDNWRAKNDPKFKEMPNIAKQVIPDLSRWLKTIADAGKDLFIFTQ